MDRFFNERQIRRSERRDHDAHGVAHWSLTVLM